MDCDLWHQLVMQLQQAVEFGVTVHKVVSHIDPNHGETEVETWAFTGNAAADKLAEEARLDLPPELWAVWERVVAHQQSYLHTGKLWQTYMMDVGAKAVVSQKKLRSEPVPDTEEMVLTVDENLEKLCETEFSDLPVHFQRDCTPALLQWMRGLLAERGPVRWMSWHQLLIDFQLTTNTPGPKNGTGRRWFEMTKAEAIQEYDYPRQALWFAHYWQNMSKSNGTPIGYEKRRPYSFTIAFWTTCVRVPISEVKLQRIESFYKTHGKILPFRSIHKHMKDIPVASTDWSILFEDSFVSHCAVYLRSTYLRSLSRYFIRKRQKGFERVEMAKTNHQSLDLLNFDAKKPSQQVDFFISAWKILVESVKNIIN